MKRSVRLLPEAQAEVEEAFAWYESQRKGLGLDFLLSLDAVIENVRRLPEGNEAVALRTRRAVVRRFPCLVLYTIEPDVILITAVFHAHRDSRKWSDRVREGVAA